MPAAIKWTEALKDRIIEGLENHSLRQLCRLNPDLPGRDSITDYMAKDEEFSAKCARAREDHADFMDDRILEVAEKVESGALDPKAGSVVISAFQWRASKLKPKKYGERIQHDGEIGIKTVIVPAAEKDASARRERKPAFDEE